MRMFDIIAKKRDKEELTGEEIAFWIQGCLNGQVADYQTTALLMAIRINGFSERETIALTEEMRRSGKTLDLSEIDGVKADKHSSGGVGDKTSLAALPIVAAAGVKVAKLSGRGLGHTGGTVDKLESIPGFHVNLDSQTFMRQVAETGMAISGQSADLDPADKKLYALRDVTATVDSIPLIAASIMSKKLATGADVLALDVKYGSGALLQDIEDSRRLAKLMIRLAKAAGKKASALLTSMEQPLGLSIGNALEVEEAVQVLQGEGPEDLRQLSLRLAGEILWLAGARSDRRQAWALAGDLLDSGAALEKFKALILAQGGCVDWQRMAKSPLILPYPAPAEGYVAAMDTAKIGYASLLLGAGRAKAEDTVDHAAGIVLCQKRGAYVHAGDTLAYLHCREERQAAEAAKLLQEAVTFSQTAPETGPLIAEIISTEDDCTD
ncbi:MAG: thymidine phosphorylase [Firmicutes bacterium]|nr:thymidine phosphorylase [Bacillota bacterium]